MSEPAWSHGGHGGTRAVIGDLEIAAGGLVDAAEALERAARALGVAAQLAMAGARPALGIQAAAVGCAREADALRTLAGRLTAAVAAYLEAERAAHHGVSAFTYGLDVVGDHLGRTWRGLRAFVGAGWPGVALALPWMPTTGTVNEPTVGAAMGAPGDAYDSLVGALAAAVRAAEALEPDLRGVEAADAALAVEAPTTVEELMGRLVWLGSLGDGSVAVETVQGPVGARHIVYIPGTQDWGVLDGNPADLESNLQAVTGGASDAAVAVVEAMRAQGIGADEPVMLVGHSQGGIIATVVAAQLASTYRVTHVVTAGAPTGRLTLPSQVEALHLENLRDVVPGLDGRRNPATPTRTTVTHDRRHSEQEDVPDASHTLLQAHGLRGYAQTARLVDEGLTPSTRAWRATATPMLAGGASSLQAYRPVTG
ncbi:PE-PPE domain-containing protein [Demequina iriomotensis]|uniref:PE-PPE domain-containing protein n=1 Tax=Demequina iriomotensis TaxID=1536641 RepID=UPI0012E05158|nr:PE-PPE domain-containing protein [Demequina iriomotensis]